MPLTPHEAVARLELADVVRVAVCQNDQVRLQLFQREELFAGATLTTDGAKQLAGALLRAAEAATHPGQAPSLRLV